MDAYKALSLLAPLACTRRQNDRMSSTLAAPSLTHILNELDDLADSRHFVSVAQVLETVGRSSFGPFILVPGLIVLSPLGGMPGVPTLVALVVGIAAFQLIIGRCYFWLPYWLLKRKAPQAYIKKSLAFMRPIARVSETMLKSRVRWLTGPVGTRGIAAVCLAICLIMPPLEVVPFANTACGAALTLFGFALIARDGWLAGLSLVFCVAATIGISMALF